MVGPPLWKIWKSIGMMTFPILMGKMPKIATKPPTSYKIFSSCYTFFLARHGCHGMIGLPSTAAAATNDKLVYGMINSWSQNPGSSDYWYDKVWHNKVIFFCKNLTVLSGVICRVRGVICRNCETTHFQFRHSRFFRYHAGDKTWAHATT